MMEYEIVRSNRKTLAIYIRPDGRVEVRAPLRASKTDIDGIVLKKLNWIEATRTSMAARQEAKRTIRLTEQEEDRCKKQAKAYLLQKCRHFSAYMELRHGAVKINSAKTRWGSCNRKGDINFTFRLLFLPEEVIDYVVVHELAHLKEMNHSPRFWNVVERTMPDYRARRKKLRELERQLELDIIKNPK